MPTLDDSGPNPDFHTFLVSPRSDGFLQADLRTGHLLGADRSMRGRARVRLDIGLQDLLGCGPRRRYFRIAASIQRALVLEQEGYGEPED